MLTVFIINLIFFNIAFLVSLRNRDFSIVDQFWGPSFVGIGLSSVILNWEHLILFPMIVLTCVFLWAFRLFLYIYKRAKKKNTEDFRYTEYRNLWGNKANIHAYLKIFTLQAILSYISTLPLMLSIFYPEDVHQNKLLFTIFILIWIIGFLWEAIADNQKNNFKRTNLNKPCRIGLWKYSRHPNYFGELLMHWSIFIALFHFDYWYIAIIGPIVFSYFLLNITGAKILDQHHAKNFDYENYLNEVNSILPWWPRQGK